jgi:glycosyltransferase involved in cell wall biosynthesis
MPDPATVPGISIVLTTRNPHGGRLRRTLAGLVAQTLHPDRWEMLLVDNASDQPWEAPGDLTRALPGFRRIAEPEIGLTPGRLRGVAESRGAVIVFVDDDNVLVPDFLAAVMRRFGAEPRLGAGGGPVVPEFDAAPPGWTREFWSLLALNDHGGEVLVQPGAPNAPWPRFAPVGAGLSVRRAALAPYLDALRRDSSRRRLDRRGGALSSGGDNDLVFTLLHAGWSVSYFPELRLTHLIPSDRLAPDYLARLNEGIQRTWVQVLALHGQCPWPAIPRWTVPLRVARAWWYHRAWTSAAARIRWRGMVGRFHGQADRRVVENTQN